ncbi:MAG: hypothetical protein ABGX04_13165 [Myxococcales bacterium]|nr:hypothetical protein [Myxococcales bacterium]HIK84807.1 hypothetical protein [Myxococcales bacterium]
MPIGPFRYERVESGAGFLTHASYQIRPAEDLAKAVVEELKRTNLFEEVFYTEREKEPNVDLFLQGSVTDMTYSGGIIGNRKNKQRFLHHR